MIWAPHSGASLPKGCVRETHRRFKKTRRPSPNLGPLLICRVRASNVNNTPCGFGRYPPGTTIGGQQNGAHWGITLPRLIRGRTFPRKMFLKPTPTWANLIFKPPVVPFFTLLTLKTKVLGPWKCRGTWLPGL